MNEEFRVSLELAKKLKEAGFPQDCDAYWIIINDGIQEHILRNQQLDGFENIAAPCVGRLGKELPWSINLNDRITELQILKLKNKWSCFYGYVFSSNRHIVVDFVCEREADALALMWLKLKELGIIKGERND